MHQTIFIRWMLFCLCYNNKHKKAKLQSTAGGVRKCSIKAPERVFVSDAFLSQGHFIEIHRQLVWSSPSPRPFASTPGKKNRKSCSGRIKKKRKMSISLLIQLGGGSLWDKASVIYHDEGNAQYRAMLIRVPSLKQWLWEAALPQIVSAEIRAYMRAATLGLSERSFIRQTQSPPRRRVDDYWQ